MLTSGTAWQIILEHAPRDQWLRVADLYELVSQHADLDDTDKQLVAGKGKSARWHRAVRNALQRHKKSGSLDWVSSTGFRLPPSST